MKYFGDRIDKHEAKLLREIRERIDNLIKVFVDMKNVRIAFSTGDRYEIFWQVFVLDCRREKYEHKALPIRTKEENKWEGTE